MNDMKITVYEAGTKVFTLNHVQEYRIEDGVLTGRDREGRFHYVFTDRGDCKIGPQMPLWVMLAIPLMVLLAALATICVLWGLP